MLRELAQIGGGKFFRADNGHIGLVEVLEEINKLEKTELKSKIFSDYEDRFQYFLFPALIFLLAEILWPEKRLLLIDKINLFGTKK